MIHDRTSSQLMASRLAQNVNDHRVARRRLQARRRHLVVYPLLSVSRWNTTAPWQREDDRDQIAGDEP